MINVKELRIGNLVLIDYTESYFAKVLELPNLRIEKSSNEKPLVSNSIVHPIPLNAEWLGKRLGFKARQEPDEPLIYSILKMDLDIASMDDGYYLYTNNTDPWHNTKVGRKIEYVHQLQNIYLDLTGEELNVKL